MVTKPTHSKKICKTCQTPIRIHMQPYLILTNVNMQIRQKLFYHAHCYANAIQKIISSQAYSLLRDVVDINNKLVAPAWEPHKKKEEPKVENKVEEKKDG